MESNKTNLRVVHDVSDAQEVSHDVSNHLLTSVTCGGHPLGLRHPYSISVRIA